MAGVCRVSVGAGAGGVDGVAALCSSLVPGGWRIVTTTAAGHGCLESAGVAHEHELELELKLEHDESDEQEIVVCRFGAAESPEERQHIESALRSAASNASGKAALCLCDPVHYPLAHGGLGDVSAEARQALTALALRYLESYQAAPPHPHPVAASGEVVLVLGSGGREHALAWKLSQSATVRHVYVMPGNGGTSKGNSNSKVSNAGADIALSDHAAVLRVVAELGATLVCVGPEQPLVDGVSDFLRNAGVACFGPSALAARLEGSKAFSKAFMERHGIRTARFSAFTDVGSAQAFVRQATYPVVIKASGLAAGKGVVLPDSLDEALAELQRIMVDNAFGTAGQEVVIEERLEGEEVSLLGFCDGNSVALMPGAQDHKRVFDGGTWRVFVVFSPGAHLTGAAILTFLFE